MLVSRPFIGHWQLALNISSVTLTDMDHLYRKENNGTTQTGSTSPSLSPITTKPRNPLARESLMASTFCDGNQDLPLLYWADGGLSSPAQPPFMTNYSARHTPELSPVTLASSISSRSPEKDIGRRGAQRPSTGRNRDTFLSPLNPTGCAYNGRFGAEHINKDADATCDSNADGVYRSEDSAEEENLEMEIDGILDELMDYHSTRRVTMTSAPLLPLPEELSPTGAYTSPHLYSSSLPPSASGSTLFGGDSDTPSLVSSSPRSSRGSHFSPTMSPSLKSKKNFMPITPSTDGWRSPPSLATVPEHSASTSDSIGHTPLSDHSAAWSPNPPEGDTLDSYVGASSETQRAHHTNLPPIWTAIPEDSAIQRRAKTSISSEQTMTGDRRSRVESLATRSFSSDNGASAITEIGYSGPGYDHVYLSDSSAVSIRFAQPGAESPRRPWLDALAGRYSPTSSISPGFVDYPPPTNTHNAPSPKRGMLQSLFSQNSSPDIRKERKWSKMRDPVKIQSSPPHSLDNISFAATSNKSSEGKGKKRAEKAERRAQLAAQLKAKQLQAAAEKHRETTSRTIVSEKAVAVWEERGGMYSIDGFM